MIHCPFELISDVLVNRPALVDLSEIGQRRLREVWGLEALEKDHERVGTGWRGGARAHLSIRPQEGSQSAEICLERIKERKGLRGHHVVRITPETDGVLRQVDG